MKYDRNVLRLNPHRLTESDFRCDVTTRSFKMAVMTSCHVENCCHLVSAHEASGQRHFLIGCTFVLVITNFVFTKLVDAHASNAPMVVVAVAVSIVSFH